MATWKSPIASGKYTLGAKFGESGPMWASGKHTGLDFRASTGTEVTAVDHGFVIYAGYSGRYGNIVKLRHKGVDSWYAHLSKINVRQLQRVPEGAKVGEVGETGNTTGPHLHLEAHPAGTNLEPGGAAVDPQRYLTEDVPGGGVGGPGENLLDLVPDWMKPWETIGPLLKFVTDTENWRRVALFAGGGVLVILALYVSMGSGTRSDIGTLAKEVIK